MIDQLMAWQAKIDAAPPVPTRMRASHRVPYGRVFRQWNTRGELEVWVNRGLIHDLPRMRPAECALHGLGGIPVFFEP